MSDNIDDQRKALIEAHEIHLTPDAYAEAIVNALPYQGTPQSILEPSAGQGAFIRALKKRWPTASISAVDIIPEFEGICRESGASKFVAGDIESIAARLASAGRKFDLIAGNPPFSLAERHCRALFPLIKREESIFDKHCYSLELSVRAANILEHANIKLIGELVQKTDFDLLRTPGLGRTVLAEIKEVLTGHGLTTGMTPSSMATHRGMPWIPSKLPGMLAFLLRSAFLATKERRPFWEWIYSTEAPVGFTWRLPIETRTTFKQPAGWPELLSKSGKTRGSDTHEYECFVFEAGRPTIPVSPRPIRVKATEYLTRPAKWERRAD